MNSLPKSLHLEDNSSTDNPNVQQPIRRITVEEAIENGYQKLPPRKWVKKDSKVFPDFYTITPDPDREGWDNIEYYQKSSKNPKDRSKVGWVYILTNESHPGILKIGHTTTSVNNRVKQLNSTGVLGEWKPVEAFMCLDSYALEQDVHRALDEFRSQDNREFFNISLMEATEIVKHYLKDYTYF